MADKEVRVKIVADTSDIKKKLSDLEKSLKDVAKTLDNVDNDGLDKITKSVKEFEDAVELADDSVDELDDSLDKLDNNGNFNKSTKGVKEFGDALEKTTDSAKELDDSLDKLDNNGLDKINKDTEELRENINLATNDMKEFNRQQELAQDTSKENNTIFDRLKTLFNNLNGEATSFGDKFGKSFEKSKSSIFEMISAFSNMKTATKLCETNMDDLTKKIDNGNRFVEMMEKKFNDVNEKIKQVNKEMVSLQQEMDFAETKEDAEQMTKKFVQLRQELDKLKKQANNYENAMKGASSQVEQATKELNELNNKAEESEGVFSKFTDSMKEGNLKGAISGLKDAFSKLFQKIPTEGKVAIAVITALGIALKKCAEQGVKQLEKGFDTLGNVFSKISSVAKSFGQEIKNAFENLTDFELDMSSMIETAVNFEDTMVRAGAICGVFGEDLKPLEELARKLGATTRYSATEVAQAMAEMGQQGFTLEEIMSSVEGVLHLATIGNLDLARSSEIVTNTLNAYGMEASESNRLVDILAQTSVKSGTNVEQLAQALENCSATAGALGISVEDTATAIGLMGDNFIKSGKAGTSLNTFMANMSKPTKAMTDCLAQYNLEGARQKILNGDLIEGYKEFAKRMEGLTNEQKAQIATTIAGKEGMTGFLAIVNSGVKGIEELEHSIEKANGVAKHLADTFDNTLKGALSNLASGIEERLLQVMDKIKPMVKGVIEVLNNFLDIWNGMSEKGLGSGFADAIAYLEKESREWGKAIEKGLQNIIKSIDDFANSKAFDNLLQVGTNIINGICNGISKAKENGTLDSAINGIITKVVDWVGDNLDTIIQAGMDIVDGIVKGIEQNGDSISKIIKEVLEMQTDIDSSINYAKWKVIGENMGTFIIEGIESVIRPFFSGLEGFAQGLLGGKQDEKQNEIGENFNQNNQLVQDTLEDWGLSSKWSEKIANVLFPPKETFEQKGKETGEAFANGTGIGVESKKEDLGNKVDQNFKDTKPKTDATANEIGQGVADGIGARLEELDAGELKILQDELKILQEVTSTVAQGIAQSFTDIRNSARTEITGMTNIFRNQFTSMTNIVRNQMVNVANICKNQFTNITNNFRTSFVNMSNICKNQFTNITNNFRTSFISMSNICKNQMTNMTNSFRTSFVNLSNICKNQFTNMTNTIRTSFVNMSNICKNQMTNITNNFRTSFTGLSNIAKNQMQNVSNTIRTQAISWSNIISNQISNARNTFTSQMISMSSVARTQMVNVSNIIRNQAVSWSNVINNQSKNARDNLTRQFMSMHSVVSTQMAKCLSTVRSYMSQIASATNKTMTMNFKVNKTVTTTNVTKNVTKGLDPISTMDSMNTNIRSINPSTMASGLIGGDINFNLNGGGASGNLALEIPLYIDGREIARATATYSQQELAKLSKRSNRKRGE